MAFALLRGELSIQDDLALSWFVAIVFSSSGCSPGAGPGSGGGIDCECCEEGTSPPSVTVGISGMVALDPPGVDSCADCDDVNVGSVVLDGVPGGCGYSAEDVTSCDLLPDPPGGSTSFDMSFSINCLAGSGNPINLGGSIVGVVGGPGFVAAYGENDVATVPYDCTQIGGVLPLDAGFSSGSLCDSSLSEMSVASD